VRVSLRLGVGVAAVAAVVATGAFAVSGSDTITTIAGTGTAGFSGDGGPATLARLFFPDGVATDGQGNVYIADTHNGRVRKVSAETITTIAGTGEEGFSGDGGPAISARLFWPEAVAVDGQGNVYIADRNNHRVRGVSPGGTITTIAGTGAQGFSGDGGPATSAQLSYPSGIAVDGEGNVYIADRDNSRVRKVSAGTIATFAGTGAEDFFGDGGPATSARLDSPGGVAVDGQGDVYIADTGNRRVRKVSGGTITTFAGTGVLGSSGDGGPATSARLALPVGVAADAQGSVYIADTSKSRVRKVGTSATASAKFYSPGHNLSCGMADGPGRAAVRVKCQSRKLPHSVSMGLDGRLKICRGARCLSNPGANTPTLGYGRQIAVGRFRCRSQPSGVRCTVIRSGKGFLIDKKGVRRVGP
jgi:sugar lactone lactonase YvrE